MGPSASLSTVQQAMPSTSKMAPQAGTFLRTLKRIARRSGPQSSSRYASAREKIYCRKEKLPFNPQILRKRRIFLNSTYRKV